MKTGECKFGENCKFHHPIDRSAPSLLKQAQQQAVKLTLAGLPRREVGNVHVLRIKCSISSYFTQTFLVSSIFARNFALRQVDCTSRYLSALASASGAKEFWHIRKYKYARNGIGMRYN